MILKIKASEQIEKIINELPDIECFDGKFSIQSKLEKILGKHVKFIDASKDGYTVRCDDYGYSLLRLEFYKPYYNIQNVAIRVKINRE